jgi:hypothetical protein
MRLGMIAQDFNGLVMGARSLTIECLTDPTIAEAMTILYATKFSLGMGFLDIIMEGNALQIVKEVNSDAPCLSNYGHFVEEVKSGLSSLRSYSFVHVKREVNLAAHGLARKATTHVVDITWMKKISNVIYGIVCRESCTLTFLSQFFEDLYKSFYL